LINKPHRQSEQAIIKKFLDSVDDINDKYSYLHIKIIWIPGHIEIDENEHANEEAKKTLHPSTSQSYNHRPLKLARTRAIKKAAKKQWDMK
jgi:ribonuclease HI